MDKVERAVITFDGVWPSGVMKDEGCVLENYLNENVWTVSRFREADHICTYPEFMEARKRLEGRPDWQDVPEWVNWIAQSPCGHWEGFNGEPMADHYWRYGGEFRGEKIADGKLFTDWRQSLEPRPQRDHKEGEGVEWEPMESAPKDGSDVIGFEHGQGLHITWWDATHDLGRGGWRMAHHGWRPTHWMRLPDPPEKSHRDKVIEAAYDATDKRELGCCEWQEHARRIFEQLYKADLLKLPGDEQ